MKHCHKCGESKPLDEFNKNKRNADGVQHWCRLCQRARKAEYRAANAEQIKESGARYRAENAERERERNRRYNEAHKDVRSAWMRANTDRIRENARRYRDSRTPEQVASDNANRAQHKAANRDLYNVYESRRRARRYGARHEPYKRAEIFARWGNVCCYCDAPAEHLDHVHALSKGGADAAHNLVPACAPCNLTKSDKSLADWASTF